MPREPMYTVQDDIEWTQQDQRVMVIYQKGERIPLARALELHDKKLIDKKPTADADPKAATATTTPQTAAKE